MMAKVLEGFCAVCGSNMSGGFIRNPKIFDKRFGDWCFACWHVPDQKHFDETGERVLNDTDYMIEGGWNKKDAAFHVKAVKKLLKVR